MVVPDVVTWMRVSTGHDLPSRIPSSVPEAVGVVRLQGRLEFAAMAHHPDNFACVHCRPPELALLEELGDPRARRQHHEPEVQHALRK